jgi:hypothetical protein
MGADPYKEYLQRFESKVGAVAVGGFGKFRGKLIKKLAPHEFLTKHDELTQLSTHYQAAVARGDTLNDTITKLIGERQAELLLDG